MTDSTQPHGSTTTIPARPTVAARPGAPYRPALDVITGVGLFAAALLVYNATLTPSLSYLSPDGNELATVPYILGLAHSTGYPLYTWLGKLFTFIPIGDVAHRMNLMSAAMGAGGVSLLYGIVLIVLERAGALHLAWRRIIAAGVALIFAFSTTFWSQTGISEVYTPNLFMVGLQTLLILHWARVEEATPTDRGRPPTGRSLAWFGAFCLTFALSTGTHSSSLGFGLGYVVFVLAVNWRFALNVRALAVGVGAFGLGMLQHLWLPYKASTLTDSLMQRNAPNTWQGFYNYTLGAFPNFKFAFTWVEVPDRVVIYLDLLRQQFGVAGILGGIAGMWALLFGQPKRWWLLALMYLVHVIFFTQYRVFDLDVFFIAAHYLFAIFLGAGVGWLAGVAGRWIGDHRARLRDYGVSAGLAAALVIPVGVQLSSNWATNNRSGDVAINDFYENVFEVLPSDAVLVGRGGVFGYDMFYWRLVYDVRPDVTMPHLPGEGNPSKRDLAGRPLFSTTQSGGQSVRSAPPGMLPADAWYVPVLLGNSTGGSVPIGRQSLVLYAVSGQPPELFVERADPQVVVGASLGGMTLVGYDLDVNSARPGGRLRLTLYWQGQASQPLAATMLGETTLEAHQLGLGNAARYAQSTGIRPGATLVEDYWVVIPSTLAPGDYPLIVSADGESAEVGQVSINAQ
jgi:hypothetical protein